MPGYVINVSRIIPIQHIFRTAEDSITDFNEAQRIAERLEPVFPATLFDISIDFVQTTRKRVWTNQPEDGEPSGLIIKDGGNAYRMKLVGDAGRNEYILEHAGIFTDGSLGDFGAVGWDCIGVEEARECRRIEKALLTAMGVL